MPIRTGQGQDTGRFFQLGLFGLSAGYFSAARIVTDWLIWRLVFVALFHGVRALIRG